MTPTPTTPASSPARKRKSKGNIPLGLHREGVIVIRLESLDRLFDPADPSPVGQQDLSPWADQYILESLEEMESLDAQTLEILLACGPADARYTDAAVQTAVQTYFARQATLRSRSLKRMLKRGLITLLIGIAFLVSFYAMSRGIASLLGDTIVSTLLREGSLIVGWVAMWRPIEIFLYDWWPIVGERRLLDRLSRLSVRIIHSPAAGQAPQATPAEL